MPAASTKPETKSSSEVVDPMKQAINLLDKKVRNLEKRKSKLDSYKEKADNGNILEKDQEEAIAHYTEVIQNLEFAKELQKQYLVISQDAEKGLKKQAKREKVERQMVEVKRFRELLQLQGMLDSLGSDNVRSDFKTGKQGAVVLTEENLNQFDELYKLISPSRDGEKDYQQQLSAAAEHLSNLLEGKEKEVVGTTYKELRELMVLINGCGYFENMPKTEQGEEETQEEGTVDAAVTEDDVEDDSQDHLVTEEPQQVISVVAATEPVSHQYTQQSLESEVVEGDILEQTTPLEPNYPGDYTSEAAAAAYNRQRPFQEIVSSVQGSFNFLQESTIDIESPHMDPAVVAMGPAPIPHPSNAPGESYSGQLLISDHHHHQQQQSSSSAHLDSSEQTHSDYNNQAYNHSTSTYSVDDTAIPQNPQNPTIHSQSAGLGDPAVVGMMTAHLPIPNQANTLSQDEMQDSDQTEKKPFTMNANAAVFQSMYSPTGGNQGGGEKAPQISPPASDYQSNYQGNNFRGTRGYRGGRGNRGGTGVSNGYSKQGSRGGNVNGRAGFNRDNREGDRAQYQGYPPRNDYRPEGYQGFGNNNNSSAGYNNSNNYYNKRGGPNRGGMRGGPRGSGSSRGGSRGGGMNRPMNNNQ